MLGKASHLALSGFLLSFVAAAPALAQGRSPDEAPVPCYRTIDFRSAITESSQSADPRCGEPRERRRAAGGWLDHAIILVEGSASRVTGRPTPATAWQPSRPSFTAPPVYR
jgi:hypothetical protein